MAELLFFDRIKRFKNHFEPMHTHSGHEIVFYCGKGKTTIGEKEYPIRPGSLAVIESGVPHCETHFSDGEVAFFGFNAEEKITSGVYGGMIHIEPLINDIITEARNQKFGYARIAGLKAEEILTLIARENHSGPDPVKDLLYCRKYIEENYMKKISISRLADMTGYSYDYFRHLFVKEFCVSPQTFLINTRLENAARLLAETALSCTEIAYTCGFSDSGQLTKMFRKKYSCTPIEMRKHSTV